MGLVTLPGSRIYSTSCIRSTQSWASSPCKSAMVCLCSSENTTARKSLAISTSSFLRASRNRPWSDTGNIETNLKWHSKCTDYRKSKCDSLAIIWFETVGFQRGKILYLGRPWSLWVASSRLPSWTSTMRMLSFYWLNLTPLVLESDFFSQEGNHVLHWVPISLFAQNLMFDKLDCTL